MKRPIYRIIMNTFVFFMAAQFLPIHAATPLHFLGAGLILWIVNLLIRPVLIILTIPLNLLTLGIFTNIINTWMIMITSGLVPGFYVRGFGVALMVSIMVSLANLALKRVLSQH
ncbi:phage holin family protein [Desulfosporosinus sp. SB140]|uniref:phage holin family protein n=1 Tax=Desulfosporosinus paludis TaxID=3115649 RepID=UPI00388F4AC9